ncbi:MAG: Smr/MutS family protein [Dehalococcoidales bacterium]|nr:Smr/MutS family protein [Dehalococcoidales bacterium]
MAKTYRHQPISNELDLHALTVDEALMKLDRYLHDSFRSGYYTVRIVHGKGTGTLRNAVRQYLEGHSLVKSFRWGEPHEGGIGVTVVELAAE